ncbi:hypothetical protein DFR52_102255 [Hoeflea marina]|uniref:Uncharacterized protein n=1 Tax=Hoeflea marina TaxID=274592 RepID=A0A317PKV9_9HYPH|nr:hypothetical protein [Hoeflea marina]PWW01592.1 hypothetical protein DFR52_102255 [Hoeflea marina]
MEIVLGAVLLFASLLLLALVGRYSTRLPNFVLFRGIVMPSIVAVFFTALMTIGLTMMIVGGEDVAPSIGIEMAFIMPLLILGGWLATRLTGTSENPDPDA